MASTYVNDLRLNEMATGDQSGAWGTVTNTNLELIGDAFGYATEAITTNADTHATVIANGAADAGRAMVLKYTGTLDSACTITISGGDASTFTVSKLWYIHNATSGSQNIIITSGSGANITIANGQTKCVYTDGAGSGGAVIDTFAALSVVDLFVDDDLTVTDDLTVNGATTLAGVLDITDTTDASDATGDTGALRTEGGASIAKKLFVGTDLDVDGTTNLDAVDIDGAVQLDATLTVGANDQGYDVTLHGDTAARNVVWDSSADSLIFSDNAKAIFGAGSDLKIFHDGSDSWISDDAGTGNLYVRSNDFIILNAPNNETLFRATQDGSVILYHNNAIKLATTATGVAITGTVKPTTYQETYVASSAASTVTLDLATATSFSLTMGQATTFAFSNPPGSGTAFSFTLFLTQHSSAVAITWPNTVDWAGGSAPDAAAADALQAYAFFTRDGGTTYYGFLGGTAIA